MLLVDVVKIPVFAALGVVALLISAAMVLSLVIPPRPKPGD